MSSDNFKVLNGLVVGDTTIIDSSGVWVGPVDPNIEASFTKANTATTTAQAAFDKANTGGVQSVTANSSARITQNGTQGAVTFDLATSGASEGTYSYPSMNVDSYGRVTSISSQTPVTSFGGQTGAITLSSANVVSALTYTPANKAGDNFTGPVLTTALTANTTITLGGRTNLSSNTYTTSSNSQIVVDSFATTDYRSAKYLAQMMSGTSYHAIELFVIHDGTTSFMNEYGEVYTGSSLGDFETSITSGNVNLLFTPNNNVTVVDVFRTALVPGSAPLTKLAVQLFFEVSAPNYTLYFPNSTLANQFASAHPSVWTITTSSTSRKFSGGTVGSVVPSGPYYGVTVTGATESSGTAAFTSGTYVNY